MRPNYPGSRFRGILFFWWAHRNPFFLGIPSVTLIMSQRSLLTSFPVTFIVSQFGCFLSLTSSFSFTKLKKEGNLFTAEDLCLVGEKKEKICYLD